MSMQLNDQKESTVSHSCCLFCQFVPVHTSNNKYHLRGVFVLINIPETFIRIFQQFVFVSACANQYSRFRMKNKLIFRHFLSNFKQFLAKFSSWRNRIFRMSWQELQGGHSLDTHVVISHVLTVFFFQFRVCFHLFLLIVTAFRCKT